MAYAEDTKIPFERSISEISTMLRRGGAKQIATIEEDSGYAVQFAMADRVIRFRISFPPLSEMPLRDGRNSVLTDAKRRAKLEQVIRQKGRALMLVIKAKLESVESEVETFEEAFFANIVLPGDQATIYERIRPALALEYQSKGVETLRLGGPK